MSIMMTLERATSATSLRARLIAAHEAAQRAGAFVLVSHSEPLVAPDPITVFARAQQVAATRLYWASPQNALILVGVGAAREFTASGPERFAQVAAAWQALLATAGDGERSSGFGVQGAVGQNAALDGAEPGAAGIPHRAPVSGGVPFD